MIKVCLIGYGKWGKLLFKKLDKISIVIKILDSKNYSLKNLVNCDWVVIATPNKTHYKIVKDCLKLKKNIVCEKPLVPRYTQALELYDLAERNGVKIFVSDFTDYKKKIEFKKENIFQRFKNSKNNFSLKNKRFDLLYDLAYHDISYIYKFTYLKKINLIKIISSKSILKFIIKFKNHNFLFHYDNLKSKKIYTFNKTSLYQRKDIIKKMFCDYFYKKKSYIFNKKKSLFIIRLLEKIKNEI